MGEELTVELTDMAHGGEAIGRHEGKVIFVPHAIAGEQVRVRVVQDRGRFAHARLLEVLSPSTSRVKPPCPHSGLCGGCHWQHISYAAQLEHKRSIVAGQLGRIAGVRDIEVQPTLGMVDPWRYRNHAQFHVSSSGQLGFMAAQSHKVVSIERCLIIHPLLEELFDALEMELPGLTGLSLRAGINTGEQMIVFEMAEDQAPDVEVTLPVSCVLLLSDGTPVTLLGSPHIHERIAERVYQLSAPSFFQVNTSQAEVLVQHVCSTVRAEPGDVIIDAYCGVGTFALALAPMAGEVVGIESSATAMADARVNASEVGNVRFLEGAIESVLPTLEVVDPVVILDPPREGLGRGVFASLLAMSPRRIVYVSCDPATLARDLKGLLAGGYSLRNVQPIDMFPHTYHIETVAVLERAQGTVRAQPGLSQSTQSPFD